LKILGYGEDAFTLRVIQEHDSEILELLEKDSSSVNSLAFFRPSFGRSGGKNSSQFGEFDLIIATSNNVYLIESKWDNFKNNDNDVMELKSEQILRHKIFSWYYVNWSAHQYKIWNDFVEQKADMFSKLFSNKLIAQPETLLAQNLETVLVKLREYCTKYNSPINVLLFFHGAQSQKVKRVKSGRLKFEVINIDYSKFTENNFTSL
jgi:hypothetical protein|tara:strand:+ start:115 stop:732 length:618 start_codon:yes stop_codon:yes gene_type:complete